MNISSSDDEDNRRSPPTSPILHGHHVSPATSPFRGHSPKTSPLANTLQSSRSSDSSSSESGPQRKRRRKHHGHQVSRTTILSQLRAEVSSDDCSNVDEQHHFCAANEVPEDNNRIIETGQADTETVSFDPGILSDSSSSAQDLASASSHEEDSHSSRSESSSAVDGVHDSSADNSLNSDNSDVEDEHTLHETDMLFEGSAISADEAILKALKVSIGQSWSKTSLDATVKLIKSLLPSPNLFPSSGRKLLDRLNELSAFQETKEHFYCCKCQQIKNKTDVCENCVDCECKDKEENIRKNCDCKKTGVFFEFSVEAQLKYMFEHRGLATAIDQYNTSRVSKEGCICDIIDGSEYIKVRSELRNHYDIVLLGNSDGVELSTSSKQELWPILSTPCEVHPRQRSAFILVSGGYVDKKKPNMNIFFKPFVDSLNRIRDKGGIKWIHPELKTEFTSEVVCPVLSADAPAKAILLNMRYFSHRFGCNICEQKAVKVKVQPEELENAENPQAQKKGRKKKQHIQQKTTLRRFVYTDEVAPLRSDARMKLLAELAAVRNKSRKGIIGPSVLSDLPLFDMGVCTSAEYLHSVLLGPVKYFLNVLCNVRGPWFIGNNIENIDAFLYSIKVPDFMRRLPRGLKDLQFWKGSELRAFLLFYSLPALKQYLPNIYFQHWMLLVAAISLLLSDCISEDNLNAAEVMLRCFVREIGNLYHKKFYTYNVHNLLHLCLQVRRWENLWSTSAFKFESFNGFITKHVHGTKQLGKELLNNIKIIQSTKVLENILSKDAASNTTVKEDVQILSIRLSIVLSDEENLALSQMGVTSFELFDRIKVKYTLYTSKHYDQKVKRANSIVKFYQMEHEHPQYGEILHFVRDCCSNEWFCLISTFRVRHRDIFFIEASLFQVNHLVPVEISGDLIVVPISHLVTKVIKAGRYLCLRPNSYEVNL